MDLGSSERRKRRSPWGPLCTGQWLLQCTGDTSETQGLSPAPSMSFWCFSLSNSLTQVGFMALSPHTARTGETRIREDLYLKVSDSLPWPSLHLCLPFCICSVFINLSVPLSLSVPLCVFLSLYLSLYPCISLSSPCLFTRFRERMFS